VSSTAYDHEIRRQFGVASSQAIIRYVTAGLWFRLGFATFDEYTRLSEALYFGSIFPIVDRYNAFVRVLQTVACTDTSVLKTSLRAVVGMAAKLFADPRLRLLKHLIEPTSDVQESTVGCQLAEITHRYTMGDYGYVSKASESSLQENQDCLEFYEFFAKSLLHMKAPFRNPLPDTCVAHRVLASIFSVLKKDEDTSRSLEFLRKFSYFFDSARLGVQVLAFVLQSRSDSTSLDPRLLASLNGITPTARFATCFSRASEGLSLINRLDALYPQNKANEFFRVIVGQNKAQSECTVVGVPLARQFKYRAEASLRVQDYARAIIDYQNLLREAGDGTPFQEDGILGLFASYLGARSHTECARLIVDTYILNKHLLSAIRWGPLIRLLDDPEVSRDPHDICWPILQSILTREGHIANDSWSLYVRCDDFLNARGMDKPSEVLCHSDQFPRNHLVYFLRHVCVPEVLCNSPTAFESTHQLENERITICQALLDLDPTDAETYSKEIHELIRTGMIRSSLKHVLKSKIYIDTSGIVKSLSPLCSEKFKRCLALTSLDEHLRKTPAVQEALCQTDRSDNVIVWTDLGFEIFKEVFDDIKKRFIFSDEYGLDSYISVRIRHGTLAGQLRSQFENEHLITRLNREMGKYDENGHWTEMVFRAFGEEVCKGVNSLLIEFSQFIDDTIDVVKRTWLQIRGKPNNNAGLFDFDYTDKDLLHLWGKVFIEAEVSTYEGFIEAVFAELKARTHRNLEVVQDRIRGELKERLIDALDTMSGRVFSLHADIQHSSFSNAVTRCRTGIQNELDLIAEWFENIEQGSFPDFTFSNVVDTTLAMVDRCYPSQDLRPTISIDDHNVLWHGTTFTSLIDLMFIILENVAKHSALDESGTIVPLLAARVSDSRFDLRVSNPIRNVPNITELKARLAQLDYAGGATGSGKLVRTEGGSGYYKLNKIIKHDLKRNQYQVSFGVIGNNEFLAAISMETEGITK
jgi:hypothetical protein